MAGYTYSGRCSNRTFCYLQSFLCLLSCAHSLNYQRATVCLTGKFSYHVQVQISLHNTTQHFLPKTLGESQSMICCSKLTDNHTKLELLWDVWKPFFGDDHNEGLVCALSIHIVALPLSFKYIMSYVCRC